MVGGGAIKRALFDFVRGASVFHDWCRGRSCLEGGRGWRYWATSIAGGLPLHIGPASFVEGRERGSRTFRRGNPWVCVFRNLAC